MEFLDYKEDQVKNIVELMHAQDNVRLAFALRDFDPSCIQPNRLGLLKHEIIICRNLPALDMILKVTGTVPEMQRELFTLAADFGYVDAIEVCLENGLDINGVDSGGETPLYTAIINGYFDCAKKLIDLGADITILPPSPPKFVLESIQEVKKYIAEKNTENDHEYEAGR